MTTTNTLPEFITEGARVSWDTWCGVATVTIEQIDRIDGRPIRIWTDTPGQWFEATCFHTLAESLPRSIRPAD